LLSGAALKTTADRKEKQIKNENIKEIVGRENIGSKEGKKVAGLLQQDKMKQLALLHRLLIAISDVLFRGRRCRCFAHVSSASPASSPASLIFYLLFGDFVIFWEAIGRGDVR